MSKKTAGIALFCMILIAACQTAEPTVAPARDDPPMTPIATTIDPGPEALATALPTATPAPTPVPMESPPPTPPQIFKPFLRMGDTPIIRSGEEGEWDGKFTDPGAIVWHEGQFHMFRNGFTAWPGIVQWSYLTSLDGVAWVEQREMPVFSSADVPYINKVAAASGAAVLPDGTWMIIFFTYEGRGTKSAVGRATAPGPMGPWMADQEPILVTGSPGEWDEAQVWRPSMVILEDELRIYYTGTDADGIMSFGFASSTDGVLWTKYDDPATSLPPFSESDPVFRKDEDQRWEHWGPQQPEIVITPEGWVMFYRSYDPSTRVNFGLAFSDDGITWTKHPANPLVIRADTSGFRTISQSQLSYLDGTYLLYLEIGSRTRTHIFLATHQGLLRP